MIFGSCPETVRPCPWLRAAQMRDEASVWRGRPMKVSRLKGCIRPAVAATLLFSAFFLGPTVSWAQEFGPVETPKVDAAKADLGKRLFFDRRLSGDAAVSCSTCHQPDKAFTDGLALSKAYPGSKGFRSGTATRPEARQAKAAAGTASRRGIGFCWNRRRTRPCSMARRRRPGFWPGCCS